MKLIIIFLIGLAGLIYWIVNILRTKEPIDVVSGGFLIFSFIALIAFAFNIKRLNEQYG